MINLQEVFDVVWTFTTAKITARDADGKYLHQFIFANEYFASSHQYRDIEEEKLTIVRGPINNHGEPTRGGTEIGWGFKKNSIPKELMEAPIRHMTMSSYEQTRGVDVYVDVELNELTVEYLKKKLADKALKWEDRDD